VRGAFFGLRNVPRVEGEQRTGGCVYVSPRVGRIWRDMTNLFRSLYGLARITARSIGSGRVAKLSNRLRATIQQPVLDNNPMRGGSDPMPPSLGAVSTYGHAAPTAPASSAVV
jgi:hypothetical protein